MGGIKKKVSKKTTVSKSKAKPALKANAAKTKVIKRKPIKKIETVTQTRPTQKELKSAAKKVMKQYSAAIKNLAHR